MEKMSPEQITLLSTSIALDISKGKSIAELNVLRNVASQISCCLLTIISQKTLNDIDNQKK